MRYAPSICFLMAGVAACQSHTQTQSATGGAHVDNLPGRAPVVVNQTSALAGVQYADSSLAGQTKGPDADYWSQAARAMSARFNATPSVLWTVGNIAAPDHIRMTFARPAAASDLDPHIEFAEASDDPMRAALKAFDQQGMRVWLMIEPGAAPVEQVIELVLTQYNSHPSLAGVGVDAGWLGVAVDTQGTVISGDSGTPVTDAQAQSWLDVLHRHDPGLRLLLQHWQSENLPPTLRQGLMFMADGQGYASADALVADFADFARKMTPAPVGLLYGTGSDARWWCHLADAPLDIGNAVLTAVSATQGLFWSDESALEAFPQVAYSCDD